MVHSTVDDEINRLQSRARWHMARARDSRESVKWQYRIGHPNGPIPMRYLYANSDVRIHLAAARAAREVIRKWLVLDRVDG